ncbi:MAG TPA: hypothetical protein VLF39_01805 [Candidatus Saccharimonadales bacterium]|nr:hypothetical protein [Candidatus Saccharimonadales bacterium]
MYGKVAGTSTVITGAAGVKLLPNTGGTRVMFIVSVTLLTVGVVMFALSAFGALKRRVYNFLYS